MEFDKLKKELGHKQRSVSDLISYIKTRTNKNVPNYSMLLGAGASVTSGIDSGADLVGLWRKEIYLKYSGVKEDCYEERTAKEYLISNHSNWYSLSNEYSALFEHKFDLAAQRRRFVEMEVDKKLPSIGYSYLVSLAQNRFFDTVYTTNFDDLLNEAFYQFSQTRPIVCAHDSSLKSVSISSSRPKIIKLHGDYLFEDIKSTHRETESLETNTKDKLIQFSKEYGLIVIGYSGNDRSVMDVINFLIRSDDYLSNGVYWCIRKGDYVNPEVTKLLWKDKVYFVEVDGFDELMAQLHHGTLGELSLKENFTNTKKESIIQSITKDDKGLSSNSQFIKVDIEHLRKHKDSMDISNTIREINEKGISNNSTFSEEDLKRLLNADRLIKEENYSEARAFINSVLGEIEGLDTKKIYQKKLIEVNKKLCLESEAIKICDELIEADPYDIGTFLLKADSVSDLTERCRITKENIEKFELNPLFHSYLVKAGLREIDHTKNTPVFSLDELFKFVEDSLKLNPSLSNSAWDYKVDIISKQYTNLNDKAALRRKRELIVDHVERARTINPEHSRVLELLLNEAFLGKSYDKAMESLGFLVEIYSRSSVDKKRKIFDWICDGYGSIREWDGSESHTTDWALFLDSKIVEEVEALGEPVSLLVSRAQYYLKVDNDVDKCLEYVRRAAEHQDSYHYAGAVITFLIMLSEDYDFASEFLARVEDRLSKDKQLKYKSNILLEKREYNEALKCLDERYSLGGDFEEYLTAKSYALLRAEKYQAVVNLVKANIDTVQSSENKDLLIVNENVAVKLLGSNVNQVQVQNVISHGYSKELIIAAECLLGHEVRAKRLIDGAVEKDYYNLFCFKAWPVIPEQYLDKYKRNHVDEPLNTLVSNSS